MFLRILYPSFLAIAFSLLLFTSPAYTDEAESNFVYPTQNWRSAVPPEGTKSFLIKYKGRAVGFHHMEFFPDGDNLVVKTHFEIIVKLGFVKVADFKHDAIEYWENGRLVAFITETKEQKKRRFAKGVLGEEGLVVEGSKFSGLIDKALMPATFWNPESLTKDELVNHQNGDPIKVETSYLGMKQLNILGETKDVLTYSFAKGDAYYTRQGAWVGGAFRKKRDAIYEICSSDKIPPKKKWHYASDILLKDNPFE